MNEKNIQERIEHYCLGLMSAEEKKVFEIEMSFDQELTRMVRDHFTFIKILQHKTAKDFIKNQLDIIKNEHKFSSQSLIKGMQVHINRYWKTASVAASVAFVASTITFFIAKKSFKQDNTAHIVNLNKKLNAIQSEQNKIKRDVKQVKDKQKLDNVAQDEIISKSNGTAFAISNDGLLITNSHVIDNNPNIFVITNDQKTHKATAIYNDAENDIAVLKIEEEDFVFSKAGLPYTLKSGQARLSEKIFTLGYPKNEIVYNEGYLSSLNGSNENEKQYQMELPSNFGNSGAPIFDSKGNVIAIVTSKESNTDETYGVKSTVINDLLKSVKKDIDLNKNKHSIAGLSRTAQIETLKEFICIVKSN